jgi:hypothetical protein
MMETERVSETSELCSYVSDDRAKTDFVTPVSDDGHRENFRNVGVSFVTIFDDEVSEKSDSCKKYIFLMMWLLCCEYTNYLTCFGLSTPSSEVSSTLIGSTIHIRNIQVSQEGGQYSRRSWYRSF